MKLKVLFRHVKIAFWMKSVVITTGSNMFHPMVTNTFRIRPYQIVMVLRLSHRHCQRGYSSSVLESSLSVTVGTRNQH